MFLFVAVARYGLGGEFDGDDVDGGAEGALAALFEPEEQAKRVRVHTIYVPTPEEFEAAAGGSSCTLAGSTAASAP